MQYDQSLDDSRGFNITDNANIKPYLGEPALQRNDHLFLRPHSMKSSQSVSPTGEAVIERFHSQTGAKQSMEDSPTFSMDDCLNYLMTSSWLDLLLDLLPWVVDLSGGPDFFAQLAACDYDHVVN
ncbi:unnamed protein product [Protopolystoma xenopodis]|uniref:Uncharacterized protein n=1 Tax=Protopolystoma xenopodis TaxID=117903 RepID=A0A448WJD7_9PLAT|nr:unnamed protein product [Protopolystoma xenopodis]